MAVQPDPSSVKVYTVNGAPAGSSSSLPDWLTRKRAAKGKGKRAFKEQVQGTIDLIQYFEFPEASLRIKTTRDGHHVIATGVYKPQMRVFDLDQLALKFERHSDAENVDFVIISDDWTKSLHLQTDRTIEVHNQSGLYYSTRIPRFGRAIAYHFASCDALISSSGPEIYRLNLDQGRFLNPLILDDDGQIEGVNAVDVNAVHQLMSFGTEGPGTVEFWDPRSRSRVGILRLPWPQLAAAPSASESRNLAVTSLASRSDGLSLAVGTSTGHTLLYDIRSSRAYATKDQGHGLPIKSLSWIEGGSRMAGDGMLVSADKKVVKIWDRNSVSTNFASMTPATDINDVHHVPNSGLFMTANEGIQMTAYYIPQLGPAPKWCSFLDNITEEMEEQTVRSVYEDYKFVERAELSRLGLDHLIGTPTIKPYMHGYFLSLRLYDAARIIANPFAYAEHREKAIRDKMDKLAENRIRAPKDAPKVNKALAERVRKAEEREERRREKKRAIAVQTGEADVVAEEEEEVEEQEGAKQTNLLNDPRFQDLFVNPEYEVDTASREFGMLNPSTHDPSSRKRKTAVEDEEDESDKVSSDGLGGDDSDSQPDDKGSDDSSDDGDLGLYDPRARNPSDPSSSSNKPARIPRPVVPTKRLVPVAPNASSSKDSRGDSFGDRTRSRLSGQRQSRSAGQKTPKGAGMETSWVPSKSSSRDDEEETRPYKKDGHQKSRTDSFGAGMERGSRRVEGGAGEDRQGRTKRRTGVRSGSKNVFRRL